jgi:NAD(P)-dependent dehydrogenase (short-subunit alcohol dehydrogenase family)
MAIAGLDGRPCVVTGAAGGIGRATALRLAREGARVLAVDLKAEELAATAALGREQGTPVEVLAADVAAAAAPASILDHAIARLGGLGVLVNNAGIGGAHRAEDTDDAEWDRFLDVDLRTVFRLSREAVRRMRPHGGAIVNIASIFGIVGFPGGAAYAAAKAGVIGITRQMAARRAFASTRSPPG